MNTFQILTSKFRFDFMHWNVSIGPVRPFSNVISIKTSCAAQKNTSNMAATVRNVIDDVTCKSSITSVNVQKCSQE
jgi:hypothetical protein